MQKWDENAIAVTQLIISEIVEVKAPGKQKPEMIVLDDINDDVSFYKLSDVDYVWSNYAVLEVFLLIDSKKRSRKCHKLIELMKIISLESIGTSNTRKMTFKDGVPCYSGESTITLIIVRKTKSFS